MHCYVCLTDALCDARCDNGKRAFGGFVAHPFGDASKIYVSWRGTILHEEWQVDVNVRA
jgi:hypothetical protein